MIQLIFGNWEARADKAHECVARHGERALTIREEVGVFKVHEFVYICYAHPPMLRQSATRRHQNFTNFNSSKLIFTMNVCVC